MSMITLPVRTLRSYLIATGQLIPKRPSLPVLACVHVSYHDQHATLTTTNLETTISQDMQSSSDTGMLAGAICIPHADLLAFAAALPEESEITIQPAGKKALVSGEGASAKLPVIDPDYWPAQSEHYEVCTLRLVASDLHDALMYGSLSRARSEARPTLAGVHISDHAGGLCCQSADGFALSRYVLPIDAMPAFDPIIAPASWCERAIGVLKSCKSDAPADLIIGTHSAILVAGGMQIATRLISGQFPRVDQFLQIADDPPRMLISAGELQRLKNIIGLASNEGQKSMPAVWHASEESCAVYAINEHGDRFVSGAVDAAVHRPDDKPWITAFDLALLLALVSGARANEVHARVNTEKSALLFSLHERHTGYLSGMAHISGLGFAHSHTYEENAEKLQRAIAKITSESSEISEQAEEELFPEAA
jgi:DNA polymerase III sliding clamp (beta) subunit (PCNA family)